ncbi:hypothetical protein P154DRAFT_122589 [Amniculicola lignicola CBS 123094]|uniref:Uncharacterized protein n=1 Tax=Amniculicola lignicola CBS 123094 TaxID=1392246 RepID=A0A6A5WUM4_9PLEO|nr:hypothetical protein P154DRAFT_122589 [Amniculicola lignicola CBS 123094]
MRCRWFLQGCRLTLFPISSQEGAYIHTGEGPIKLACLFAFWWLFWAGRDGWSISSYYHISLPRGKSACSVVSLSIGCVFISLRMGVESAGGK